MTLLALALLNMGQAALPASAQPESAVVGAGFDVESYAVALVPNLADASVRGTETIRLKSLSNGLRSVVFSPNALVIEAATADGRVARATSVDRGGAIGLPAPVDPGRSNHLVIPYRRGPKGGGTATATAVDRHYFAFDWMVCLQDSPGDKAWFALD